MHRLISRFYNDSEITPLLILPLFFYSCGVMESEYKPDIAIEIEHNLPVIDGVPTLTLNQNMWQNIHYIDFKVTLDGRPAQYSSFSFNRIFLVHWRYK